MGRKPTYEELEHKVKKLEEGLIKISRAEEDFRETRRRFRSLLKTAGSAIVLLSPERRILEFNDEAERIYGYKREDVIGKDYVELVFPKEEQVAQAKVIDRIVDGKPLRGFENVIRAQDGSERTMIWNATPWFDSQGKTIGCIGIGVDISKRKRFEKALRESERKLRHLSSELLYAQEKERKKISLELHDELGQSLTTLKLQLRTIQERSHQVTNDFENDWTEAFGYLDGIIQNTRRLSRGLSPIILEDLGLTATIKWLVDDFSTRCGMDCSANMVDIDDFYQPELQIVIYRIIQECLTNIAKHANATRVSVIVEDHGASFTFRVEDNGKGFDVAEISDMDTNQKGMGLVTMEERINMLRGSLALTSRRESGTTVNFTLPIDLTRGLR